MSLSDQTLDAREKELSSRIQTLERQLERLSARMPDETGPGMPILAPLSGNESTRQEN